MRVTRAAIVLAGGDPVDPALRTMLPADAVVVAADSGLHQGELLGLHVDYVVGDLDSADPEKNPGITIYGVNTFANNKLGAAPIGSPFWYQFAACCAASYQWSIGGGTVPPGLALNSDGVLSGTPTAPGTYTFLVRVEDPNAAIYGQRQFTLSVVTSLLQITA